MNNKRNQRAYSFIEITKADDDRREINGIATTPSVDAVGDIVEPLGGEFTLPLPFLWQHDHRQPIGHVTHARATPEGISFTAKLVKIAEPGRLKDRLDEAWHSIKSGLVRATSIGFIPLQHEPIASGGLKYTRWSWSELSAVTVPANQDCTIATVKHFDIGLHRAERQQRQLVIHEIRRNEI